LPHDPLDVFYKKLSRRFVRLEKLDVVSIDRNTYENAGSVLNGNVSSLRPPIFESPLVDQFFSDKVSKIAKEVPKAIVTWVHVDREDPFKKIMRQEEKEHAAKKRKEEREAVVGIRIDEALAIQ
jgi:hypothetical protein